MAEEQAEAELITQPQPETGPQAVMVTPAQLKKQTKRDQDVREVIAEYIKNNMELGKDYGAISGTSKSGASFEGKPTLLKPGAEKFCGLFKIRPTFKKDSDTVEMMGSKPGIIAYICELVNGRGQVVGEGRGAYKVNPETDGDYDINKAVKIAEKRAQIDAVLRTGALSDFFTQDMEDAPKASQGAHSAPAQAKAKDMAERKPSDKQLDWISKMQTEKFDSPEEFIEFADKLVGKHDNFNANEASKLLAKLFAMPKREGND